MANYPRFEQAMRDYEGKHFSEEEIAEADQELFDINQAYYIDKEMWEANLHEEFTTLEQIEHKHEAYLQDFFEDTFGEDAWDDRHEIYAHQE